MLAEGAGRIVHITSNPAAVWRFPTIRGTVFGVPIIRSTIYWVYIGIPYFRETTLSVW